MANHAFGGGGTEDIYVIGFDDFWTALGRSPIHGVKIDVQGMELDVLEGMTETLREQHPKIVVEIHSGVDRKRFSELVRYAGYRLPGIPVDPVTAKTQATYHDDYSYAFEPA
jgi:hypothetical protein